MTVQASARQPVRTRKRPSVHSRRGRWGYALLAPVTVSLLVFMVYPLCYAVAIAFTNKTPYATRPVRYVGAANFTELLADSDFRTAIVHNLSFTLTIVPLQTGLALGLALLVNRRLRGHSFFRTAFFIPIAIPLSVAGIIWKLLMDNNAGQHGIVTEVVSTFTGGLVQPDWMTDPHWMQVAVLVVSLWASVGFQMVILLAALQDVPKELIEASMIDGAGTLRRLVSVTIPSIRFPLYFVLTTTAILSFRLFDQVYVLPTRPGGPVGSTTTLMLQIVMATERGRMGLAAAASVIFFIVVGVTTLAQRRFRPKE